MTTVTLLLAGWAALVVVLLVLWRAACVIARSPSDRRRTAATGDVPRRAPREQDDRAAT